MKYFTYSEFDSPDEPGSGKKMKASTLNKLDKAREYAGIPFIINSGYRTAQHNAKVGGVKDSAHTEGYAADIRADATSYATILAALIKAGFKRIGLENGSIHADDDPDKPTPAVWLYDSTNNEAFKKLQTATLAMIKNTKTEADTQTAGIGWILAGLGTLAIIAANSTKNNSKKG
ncbi:MAG TPA: D-Ala-D-Ala carboxypeptidase family metallohydrolase [Paludibacteraceae bacterium]|nr:hypothetical protein [Bacteroidales bacterium]HQF10662.1 D-Ala-D-Ala carboxypeptidase family metallohydrolase [Paludibacteraceae bacterium]